MKFTYTAKQAYQEWGENVGKLILEALKNGKDENKKFQFLHVVRPRLKRNGTLIDSQNMPYESAYIAMKEKVFMDEGGFNEFPYHVIRWSKSSHEIWGRGRGTFALPAVRQLQQMSADLMECANKHNNPPLLGVESMIEGDIRTYPEAITWVNDLNEAVKAMDRGVLGNFPISKEIVESQQELIRKIFFNDVFVQLANLKGDRRTTLEIRERIGEGLQRLGPPIGRINVEGLSPIITRTVALLHRNGKLLDPPPELSGSELKIEYIGRLALELKSHQARGFQQWITDIGTVSQFFPEALDIPDIDAGFRQLGETYGVRADVIASPEAVDEKRRIRAEQQQAAMALEMAQAAAGGYKDTSKAAEPGSPAQSVMDAMGA